MDNSGGSALKAMKELITFTGDSLIDLIRFRARIQPDQLAYTHLKEKKNEIAEISYRELEERILTLAARLQRRQVKGERLILMYPSGLDYLVAYFATIFAGAIAVPVYEPRQSTHYNRLESILKDAQPKLLLTDQTTLQRSSADSIASLSQFGAQWFCTDSEEAEPLSAADWQPIELAPDDVVFLQYTSGSTGNPKGVMVSNGNLMHNSAMIKAATKPHADFVNVSWLPPYHDMGLIGALLQPLYSGYHCVFMSPVTAIQRPIRLLEAIQKYRGTICGGPNFIYEACVSRIRDKQLDGLDLSSWEVAFNGAEPINADTLSRFSERFEAFGFNPDAHFPCYGMAETTLFVSGAETFAGAVVRGYDKEGLARGEAIPALPQRGRGEPACGENARELVSSGRVFESEMVVKIVDPVICLPCDERQIGEIWIRGDSVASGYWQRDEIPGEDFFGLIEGDNAHRYLRTGDLGFFDGPELFISGRTKDLIIIRGKNHYPQDIEYSVANAHAELKPDSGAAFALEIDGFEQLVMLQELNIRIDEAGQVEILEEIRTVVSRNHEMQLADLRFIRPGTLPKTTSGKIQRQAAKRMYLAMLNGDSHQSQE